MEYAQYKLDANTTLATTRRHYETNRNLIDYVQNDATANPPGMVSKYQYRNDATGRRRDVVYTGSAFSQDHMFKWGYKPSTCHGPSAGRV